jgi:phosphopantetheinyl transferase (holo-ACP synthase)
MHELEEVPGLIDKYQETRARRLVKEKEAAAVKELELELQLAILEALKESNTEAIGGTTHLAKRVVKDEPIVEDWEVLQTHIQSTGEFDLLHRRLTATAVKERWDMEVEVPGVGAFPVEKLSLTKL